MKKTVMFVVIFGFFTAFLTAQSQAQAQLTKFSFVDVSRVRAAHFNNSAGMRRYEAAKVEVQAVLDELAAEIREMQESRTEILVCYEEEPTQEGYDEIIRLDAEIAEKFEYFNNYAIEKDAELTAQMVEIETEFKMRLAAVARRVAEGRGDTLVLDITHPGVVWFSRSLDITDRVIQGW